MVHWKMRHAVEKENYESVQFYTGWREKAFLKGMAEPKPDRYEGTDSGNGRAVEEPRAPSISRA